MFLCSRMFEAHMQSYKGDDPLGEWERLAFRLFIFSMNKLYAALKN